MYWLDPIPRSYPATIPQLSRNYPAAIPQRAQAVSAQAVPKHAEDSVLYELRALHIIRQRVINA
jgi:hypothetical protein